MLLGERYQPLIIRDYKYWTLVLHEKQIPYLGRCYAWWKDRVPHEGEGASIANLPSKAILECYKVIVSDVIADCRKLGYNVLYDVNFRLNDAQFGNEEGHNHHIHVHFIPRYKTSWPFEPLGLKVHDPLWGRNYARGFNERTLHADQLKVIRDIMAGESVPTSV